MPCLVKYVRPDACYCSLYSFCFWIRPSYPIYICGVVRGGSWAGCGVFPERLSEQVGPRAVLPLRELNDDIMCRQPRPPDALVCGPHQSDGNPTFDISARPRIGLLPLFCEVDGYPFQVSLRLHTQYPINGGDERRKMSTFLEACFHKRRHFSPSIASVDGLLGVEETAILKRIASHLATKWWKPYWRMCRYIKSRIAITLVWATQRWIRGSKVPAHRISFQHP